MQYFMAVSILSLTTYYENFKMFLLLDHIDGMMCAVAENIKGTASMGCQTSKEQRKDMFFGKLIYMNLLIGLLNLVRTHGLNTNLGARCFNFSPHMVAVHNEIING